MITAIKNRLSGMFYAFIHKIKDLCSVFSSLLLRSAPNSCTSKSTGYEFRVESVSMNSGEHIGAKYKKARLFQVLEVRTKGTIITSPFHGAEGGATSGNRVRQQSSGAYAWTSLERHCQTSSNPEYDPLLEGEPVVQV